MRFWGAGLSEDQSLHPNKKNDEKPHSSQPQHVDPAPGKHDDKSREPDPIGGFRCHVLSEVRSEGRLFVLFQICFSDEDQRNHRRWDKRKADCGDEVMIPEQIDGSESSDDVRKKFNGVYLTVYFFFFESHRVTDIKSLSGYVFLVQTCPTHQPGSFALNAVRSAS